MKTIKNSIIAILAIFAAVSCTDELEDRPVVAAYDAPVLTAPEEGNSYVLNEADADVLAERFIWTPANFGAGIIPNYDVEIDFKDNNFAAPQVIGTTAGATQLAISNSLLNAALDRLDATPEQSASFEVRIKAYVGANIIYSNAAEMIITPYQGIIPLQQLYILGSATEFEDNNNAANTPLFRDPVNQFLFTLTGYFKAGNLKLIENRGTSAPQYGSSADGVLAIGESVSPIVIAADGYYTVTVDIEAMTYSLAAYDASAATSFNAVGIIGPATPGGWDSDTTLTSTAGNTHIWHADNIPLTSANMKLRANGSWDLPGNWGAGTPISGVVTVNGGDFLAVTDAGNYNVWFNDIDGRYIFIPVN